MSLSQSSLEFDYPFASKCFFETSKKTRKRRHFVDDLQPQWPIVYGSQANQTATVELVY